MSRSWLLPSLVATLLLAGCSGVRVNDDWDPAAVGAMQTWRTWAWMPGTPLRTGDERVDSPLLDARVRTAVETVMSSKGLSRVEAETADCLLAYHAAVSTVTELMIDDYHGYRRGGWDTTTVQYDEGTLILDVLDARTRQLVWRGTAKRAVDPDATPTERSERAHDAVAAMLERFPPVSAP